MNKPWNRLFPVADLLAARERYERNQAAERERKIAEMQIADEQAKHDKAIPEKKPFVYQPRTVEQWDARANQMRQRPARWRGRKS